MLEENLFDNQYIGFLVVLLGTIIILSISYFILKFSIKKIAGNKKRYADYIIQKLAKPLISVIFFFGLYIALYQLSISRQYVFNVGSNQFLLLDSVFFIILTLSVAYFISRVLTVVMLGWMKVKRGFKRTPGLINKVITFAIFIIAVFVILGYFKVDIAPMVAGVGLGAVVIGLALQSTLNNFFAGVHLI